MNIIDLSHTISHQIPVFPGENRPSIIRDHLPPDAGYVTYRLESNMHTGTHIDAPYHVLNGDLTIAQHPLTAFYDKAVVIDVRGLSRVEMQSGWERIFRENKVVLFYTGHDVNWLTESYYQDYPEFDAKIASELVRCGIRIAGFDTPSPDKAPFKFHSIFLKQGRFLVENLTNLGMLNGKSDFTFMALPLKIEAEASLIRAVAIINE